ncbi:MAG: hypothetical protein QOF77_1756 [Solirubrobacteraceae bacterium]|jgi:hypothetical protein|nr:hypothetical protein [Solirubrobacteraceae bacterium]
MSVPVALDDLPGQVRRFGLGPYLVTVSGDLTPRATSVKVSWSGDTLTAGLGHRTAANVRGNGAVTLLWPAPARGDHALIVDGTASVEEIPDAGLMVRIRPLKAVLHVTRDGPESG